MKYGIETLHVKVDKDDRESIEELLFGEPYEVITDSQLECPMEENEAREEFESRISTARICEDGMLDFYLPELVRGEEILDEEATDEIGEEIYYLDYETTIEKKGFDEESITILRERGFNI